MIRQIERELRATGETLDYAVGSRGTVAIGFSAPSLGYVAKVIRDEMEFGRFVDTIDKRIVDMLATRGLSETESWNASYLFDADEPLKFR